MKISIFPVELSHEVDMSIDGLGGSFSIGRTLEDKVETALSSNDFLQLKACLVTSGAKSREITICAKNYIAKHPDKEKLVRPLMLRLFTWKGENIESADALRAIILEVLEESDSTSTEKCLLSFFQGGGTINQLASFLTVFSKEPSNREGAMAEKVQKALQLQLTFLTTIAMKTKESEVFSKVLLTNYNEDFSQSVKQLLEVSKIYGFTEFVSQYQKLLT